MMTMNFLQRECSRCKRILGAENFPLSKQTKSGYYSYCRECRNVVNGEAYANLTPEQMKRRAETRKSWKEKNKQSVSEMGRYQRLKYFGLSPAQYDDMLKAQNGVCAICKQPETTKYRKSETVRSLAVDHCHETGRIRGLLCHRCNVAIGLMLEDVDTIMMAAEYLKKHGGLA